MNERIFQHPGIVVIHLIKLWVGIIAMGVILCVGGAFLELNQYTSIGIILLFALGVIKTIISIFNYANTFVEVTPDALIIQKGWIPSTSDTIFWVNVKDINNSSSIAESFLSSGTITLLVTIRNVVDVVKIPFIPHPQKLTQFIRAKIGSIAQTTRQVTYT
jgi:hypothetical protein